MDDDIAIKVESVSKSFKLPHEKSSKSLKSSLINFRKKQKGYETQHVLKDLSFEIKKGEFFGIVGRNGSGKSTLLKIISQIYTPDKGSVEVNGKLTPFIELGVGFNPELSGRDNVYLNGALLGFSRKEMETMYDDIVKFAELERFMDQKLKNYSSGMQVRLAFSIAIQANTDILVLDEVLAVGDEAFQRKCFQYFAKLKKNNKTVILVTHDMDAVQRFCTRALMIEDGRIVRMGDTGKVSQSYRELFIDKSDKATKRNNGAANKNIDVSITLTRKPSKLKFKTIIKPKVNIDNAAVVFTINKTTGERVYRWASDINDLNNTKLSKDFCLTIEIDDIFPVGDFYAGIHIVSKNRTSNFAIFENLLSFSKPLSIGADRLDVNWKPVEKYTIKNL